MSVQRIASVSVVIPCYQCEHTIGRALTSVATQTWRPSEVILVDDASDDNTHAVLLDLRSHYGAYWLKVIRKEVNEGAGAARNAGWEAATQPYIAFLDADDAWHPRKLEIQINYMMQHPELAITGHKWTWTPPEQGESPRSKSLPTAYRVILVSFRRLLLSNVFATPTVVLKRELPHRFDPSKRYSEDYFLWLSILADGYKGALIDLPLAYIYKAPYGVSGLSGKLWEMERGELDTYRQLHRKGKISLLNFYVLAGFSMTKYAKRVIRSWAWKLTR